MTLARLEELDATATKAPWKKSSGGHYVIQTNHITRDVWKIPHSDADLDLIAEYRNALPGLVAALREAVKSLERISTEPLTDAEVDETAKDALSTIETLLKK